MTHLDCPDFKVNLYCHKSDKVDVFSSLSTDIDDVQRGFLFIAL